MFSGNAPGKSQWSTGTMIEPVASAPKVSVPSHATRAVQASGTRMRRARIARALHGADALTIRTASIRDCTPFEIARLQIVQIARRPDCAPTIPRLDVRCAPCAFPAGEAKDDLGAS